MGGRALFKKGQKCLVPHTDQYYLAHVLQAKKRDDGVYYYLLHYDGWSKKYDEWVEESGMLKFDESLLGQPTSDFATPAADGQDPPATDAANAAPAAAVGGGVGGKTAAAAAAGGGGGGGAGGSVRKRKAEAGAEAAAADTAMPNQLRLHMPPLLKKVILDDHDQVTHQYHVQPLPRRPCVRDILRAFEQAKAKDAGGGALDAATLEVLSGLLSYFDQGLRQLLLYHQEVQLHDEAVSGGKAPSEVYGGEHLVRLLVKLPELVPVATMGAQNVVTLEGRLHDLMSFLAEKQGQFFLPASAYLPNPHFEPPLPLPPLPAAPSPAAAAAGLPPAAPAAATVGGP